MQTFVKHIIAFFVRAALWFRYRIKVKGLEKLTPEALNRKGGVLFLPNHPAVFVDPSIVTLALWPRFPIRPMIVEYMYYLPGVYMLMRFLDALPMPNFVLTSNSLKKRKSEQMIQTVIDNLKHGQNFLIYPAGKTKQTALESIGGASGVPRILQDVPEANIVLVRVKGLWGSSFSRAITGSPPPMFPTIWQGVKHVFKNLIFFTPKRDVIVEFEPAPPDFPRKGSRLEINKWLENYYNQPDNLTKQEGNLPGDSLILVSYSRWKNVFLTPKETGKISDHDLNLNAIPEDIKKKVIKKISDITEYEKSTIKPEMTLTQDLGMDSLGVAEVALFLQDDFDLKGVPFSELTTVGRVMGLAAKQIAGKENVEEEVANLKSWNKPLPPRRRVKIAPGKTIPEVFLNNCDIMGNGVACTDLRTGTLTYKQMKMRALLLADYIRELPGKYIGILLPASVGAPLLIFATQLAGKIPLMVNWTVGSRHLESVKELSKVQSVLSSWAFLDKLENVDLEGIQDNLILLEDVRHKFGIKQKIKAFWLSTYKTPQLLKKLNLENLNEEDQAVLLFTSGTESMPKGVPLSHLNLLSNHRGLVDEIELFTDDILLGILPPFHSFGFTVTTVLGFLCGIRLAFSPDPTNGSRIAAAIERWRATITGGTPTFIKSIMKSATIEQMKTVRFCFSGAEKAPADLFSLMTQYGKTIDFLIEGYGITECSPVLAFNRLGKPHRGVGQAAPGVEMIVVHQETLEVLPPGSEGHILARGPNIFSGYLNPGLSSPFIEVQGKQWYKTGDMGFLDEEGNLNITGRLKRFFKVGGEMISLAAMEEGLAQIGLKKGWKIQDVTAFALTAKEIPGDRPKIYLFTTLPLNLDEVNSSLRLAGFSNLVKISQVISLPEIPLMGTGKVNYRLLETEYMPKTDT